MQKNEGWLRKEGGAIKTWKKRWCVLRANSLYYYTSKNGELKGLVPLDKCTSIKHVTYKKRKNCFEISTPVRNYYLTAEKKEIMERWVRVLNECREAKGNTKKKSASQKKASKKGKPKTKSSNEKSVAKSNGTKHSAQGKKITVDDFIPLKVIGRGSFGKVLQVKKKDNGNIYAMKVLNKATIIDRDELEHTKSERDILMTLDNPFLVHLYFSFQTRDKLYFVMDYINGGELFFHLQREKKFSPELVRFYCAEIILGLDYLHKSGVVYRDLKPENILLTKEGHICMTDFGISKQGLNCKDDRTATFCGTPEYLAPEVLEGKGYGKEVDWWSFGTLMYEMLTGLPPFYSDDVQLMYSKIMNSTLNLKKSISPDARSLLSQVGVPYFDNQFAVLNYYLVACTGS
eukprot:TRINITY_DN2028_c0_g1_i6.p1 TRINITY_DN2028_c0_g1~~TRINITY_DN2028_c0_g1_i6.p1  ORF type:complete len:402 (+),score=54.88 TRINITY_DN2028_c0_g1_i6:970-2175(+)